jgi:ribosome assembly protein 1
VSAALRLTDGALILIDVIEGFSSQTYTVLKQMYTEGIRGILVLNKIDRLIMELRMSPLDAFTHLSQIID